MTNKINTSNLKELCKSKLTAMQFENLPTILNTSKNKLTSIFKKPETMQVDMLLDLADVIDMDACKLLKSYCMPADPVNELNS